MDVVFAHGDSSEQIRRSFTRPTNGSMPAFIYLRGEGKDLCMQLLKDVWSNVLKLK